VTFEDRVGALECFKFTRRQARFVVTVALIGGYCLRRQYAEFSRIQYGRNVRDFLDALVADGLARRLMFRADRGHVYHVHSKSIYRALGQENNRNRRSVAPQLVARKLMALDVVLMDQTIEWFATEADKVDLFTTRYGVPFNVLPQRRYESQAHDQRAVTRYFVDKLPIGLRQPDVYFIFLATGSNDDAFEPFLVDHAPLFARLPSWAVVIVRPAHVLESNWWREVFQRFVRGRRAPDSVTHADLRWFFEIRQLIDCGRLECISIEVDAPRFRQLHAILSTPENDRLYADWLRRGPAALAGRDPSLDRSVDGFRPRQGVLVMRRLKYDYRHLENIVGVCR